MNKNQLFFIMASLTRENLILSSWKLGFAIYGLYNPFY
jgi:hypothetical protein